MSASPITVAAPKVGDRAHGRAHAFVATDRYRRYVLALLVAVGVVAWVDRNVFAVLLESVKHDFSFSDTELGLLSGVAFGVFYATAGLPIAWLADRYNRSLVLSAALGLWSFMTALCGLASGFLSLFLTRVGVGVGEAGAAPPSQSLVSDYFPPERRAYALGILYLYVPLGFLVGFLSGGWLNEIFGWRNAFLVVGVPGVFLAVLVKLTLREPPRGHSEQLERTLDTPPLWSTLLYFMRRRSLRHLPLAGAIHAIGAVAAGAWLPSYFIRVFDLGSGQAGTCVAIAYGLGGGVGVVFGGFLADRLAARTGDKRWYAWGPALVILLALPFAVVVYLTNQLFVAVTALTIAMLLSHMLLGPVTATMQGLAGISRRAVAAAFYLFLVNLISMGLGPVLVGFISDRFSGSLGADSIRYALLIIVAATSLWSAVHFLIASKTLRRDLLLASADDRGASAQSPSDAAARRADQ